MVAETAPASAPKGGVAGDHSKAAAHSEYRPEIDGLRAVAVIAVALFHGEIAPFHGGYVGVDVFFVISGYLITGIIWRAIQEGRFSLVHFYERRARRILPALMFVTIPVILFTLAVKTPQEARSFGESVSFLGLFASNFFFLQERGYFEAPPESFALLHTWSLAVEEQFYILFPLLLMAVGAYARASVRPVIAGLAGLSFIAAAVMVFDDPHLTFFAPQFRFWELMLGALLALGAMPLWRGRALREAAALLGMALIVVPVVTYDASTPFPGLAALPPCLGAALLIQADRGAPVSNLTAMGRALAWRPVVFVGLVSYSYYLWHWPALSAAQYATIRPLETGEAALVLVLSFLVAVFSYRFVERPFRAPGGVMAQRPLLVASAGCLLALIAVGVALQESRGWPGRLPTDVAAMTTGDAVAFGVDRSCPTERGRLDEAGRAAIFVIFCRIGDESAGPPKTLIWGDSHALSVSPAFDVAGEALGRSLIMTSRAGCPPVLDYAYKPILTWEGCLAHNAALLANLERLGVERVVLVASWATYPDQDPNDGVENEAAADFERRLRETMAALASRGIEVAIMTPVPTYRYDVPSTLTRMRLLGSADPLDRSRAGYDARNGVVNDMLTRVAAAYDARLFAQHELFCDAERCRVEGDGRPLYTDTNHLNFIGARALEQPVQALLEAF
ncbi:MAG: acyltransferase family protein [Pseudomonadota bacterium]